jgi:beta-fructofuranosidase
VGSKVKLHVFLDGSILDIFVNDTYATSIRIYANDADATGVALFTEQNTQVVQADAWNLDPSQGSGQGIEEVRMDSKGEKASKGLMGAEFRIEDDHSLHLYRGEVRIF